MARVKNTGTPNAGQTETRPFTVAELERVRTLTYQLTTWDRSLTWDKDHAKERDRWMRELEELHRSAGRRRTTWNALWELDSPADPEAAFYAEVTGKVYDPEHGQRFAPGEPWSGATA